jgi:hypothetical protein
MKPRKKMYTLSINDDFFWVPQSKFAVFHTSCNDTA